MMSLLLAAIPAGLLGIFAIALFMIPRVSFAQETAANMTGAATKAAYATALTPAFMGFTADEWQAIGVFGSLVLGTLTWIGSMAISWYFKREHLKIAKQQAAAGKLVADGD